MYCVSTFWYRVRPRWGRIVSDIHFPQVPSLRSVTQRLNIVFLQDSCFARQNLSKLNSALSYCKNCPLRGLIRQTIITLNQQ